MVRSLIKFIRLRFIRLRFGCISRRPCRIVDASGVKLSPQEIGEIGERIAANHLVLNGRKLLYKNYRGPRGGEIDIVARDGETLSFVEVKTRTRKGYGRPLDAVDRHKQQLIERGANSWLKLLGRRDFVWRFDVVEVILSDGELAEVNVVNNAF
ncbi:MAG: YraN family protein [Akkermansiaceae bacterium]|nr:YraN family protein [Akkermansiaceae bacterium]